MCLLSTTLAALVSAHTCNQKHSGFLGFSLYILEKASVKNVCENAIMQVGAHCEQFSCTFGNEGQLVGRLLPL